MRAGHLYRCKWGSGVAVILLVEDEDQVRVLAESFLQTAGHATLSAGSIEQALALLSTPEPVDLLFIDLNLKGETEAGLSLAAKAVEIRPELKVLYTSGWPGKGWWVILRLYGPQQAFFDKSWKPGEVEEVR
jgi:response regulator RpfG family c-di-GMP phosphodiesterase